MFVREALCRPGEDGIDTAKRNPKSVQKLRALGFIAPNEDSLTREAFWAYFETFEEITCPTKVRNWVDRLHVPGLHWRRPSGFMMAQMGQGFGKAYAALTTIFIGQRARSLTWFHELGHVLYPRIDQGRVDALASATKAYFPIVSGGRLVTALEPDTMETTTLPEGKYLKMNGQFYGLDHSGADAEGDELWAIVFGEHCEGFEFPQSIQAILQEIFVGLSGR